MSSVAFSLSQLFANKHHNENQNKPGKMGSKEVVVLNTSPLFKNFPEMGKWFAAQKNHPYDADNCPYYLLEGGSSEDEEGSVPLLM